MSKSIIHDREITCEFQLTEAEQRIMYEAFMMGRIYNKMGEKETPHEIYKKLYKYCNKIKRDRNVYD